MIETKEMSHERNKLTQKGFICGRFLLLNAARRQHICPSEGFINTPTKFFFGLVVEKKIGLLWLNARVRTELRDGKEMEN
jgi:hypothetical protein